MSKTAEQIALELQAPFTGADLKTRPGRGGMTFTYVDARAVAQRLDDVLGITGWDFESEVADPVAKTVKGTLTIRVAGVFSTKEDYGCPNSAQSDEPLKEASSDALRRCGALIGVGRSLYASGTGTSLSVAPRAVSVDSGKQSQAAPLSPDLAVAAAMLFAEGECPDHRTAWQYKPAGVSKAGKPYQGFWSCGGKTDGQYCKRKPSLGWVNAQQKPGGEPERTETSIEDLPF